MEIIVVLVPLMLMLVTGGIILFNWAVKNGQYDDLEGPAHRILYDDDKDRIPEEALTGLEKTRRNADSAKDELKTRIPPEPGTSEAEEAANKPNDSGN